MIPNFEPMPLPSTGVRQQPEGLLPIQVAPGTVDHFVDTAEFPSSIGLSEEEALMDEFRNAHQHLPRPRQHVAAPVPDSLPAPSKLSPRTTAGPATPKTAKATPKVPAKRRKSRSISPLPSPSASDSWTQADKGKLQEFKVDQRSRFNWKTVANKMDRTEEDVKNMWKMLKGRMG